MGRSVILLVVLDSPWAIRTSWGRSSLAVISITFVRLGGMIFPFNWTLFLFPLFHYMIPPIIRLNKVGVTRRYWHCQVENNVTGHQFKIEPLKYLRPQKNRNLLVMCPLMFEFEWFDITWQNIHVRAFDSSLCPGSRVILVCRTYGWTNCAMDSLWFQFTSYALYWDEDLVGWRKRLLEAICQFSNRIFLCPWKINFP